MRPPLRAASAGEAVLNIRTATNTIAINGRKKRRTEKFLMRFMGAVNRKYDADMGMCLTAIAKTAIAVNEL